MFLLTKVLFLFSSVYLNSATNGKNCEFIGRVVRAEHKIDGNDQQVSAQNPLIDAQFDQFVGHGLHSWQPARKGEGQNGSRRKRALRSAAESDEKSNEKERLYGEIKLLFEMLMLIEEEKGKRAKEQRKSERRQNGEGNDQRQIAMPKTNDQTTANAEIKKAQSDEDKKKQKWPNDQTKQPQTDTANDSQMKQSDQTKRKGPIEQKGTGDQKGRTNDRQNDGITKGTKAPAAEQSNDRRTTKTEGQTEKNDDQITTQRKNDQQKTNERVPNDEENAKGQKNDKNEEKREGTESAMEKTNGEEKQSQKTKRKQWQKTAKTDTIPRTKGQNNWFGPKKYSLINFAASSDSSDSDFLSDSEKEHRKKKEEEYKKSIRRLSKTYKQKWAQKEENEKTKEQKEKEIKAGRKKWEIPKKGPILNRKEENGEEEEERKEEHQKERREGTHKKELHSYMKR